MGGSLPWSSNEVFIRCPGQGHIVDVNGDVGMAYSQGDVSGGVQMVHLILCSIPSGVDTVVLMVLFFSGGAARIAGRLWD